MDQHQKVLLLHVPNISLVGRRTYNDINAGGITFAGGLEATGNIVDQHDLNAKLNTYRKEISDFKMSDHDLKTLLDIELLDEYLEGQTKANGSVAFEHNERYINIQSVGSGDLYDDIVDFDSDSNYSILPFLTKYLLNGIDFNKYDWVGLSVTRRGQQLWMLKLTLHFSLLLTSYIKQNFNGNIYIGGNTVLDKSNAKHLVKIYNTINAEHQPTSFVLGYAESGMEKFIKSKKPIQTYSYKNTNEVKVQHEYQFQHMNYPKVTFENNDDVLADPKEFINSKMLAKYSKLETVEPFQLYPYKFSEGCRFKCSFCSMATVDGFSVLTPKQTVDHLEEMGNHGAKHFRFFNDQINWKRTWLLDFCNEIVKRNLKITWNDSANLRLATAEIYSAMKEAGCIKLWYGTETIVDETLALIRKMITKDKIIKNLELAHEHEIYNCCNFIFNFPWETDEHFADLLKFEQKYVGNKVINAYQNNAFCVQKGAEYLMNPAKFKIEILEQDALVWDQIHYNEVGGKQWDEIVKDAWRKSEILNEQGNLWSFEVKEIRSNDFILTALHKAGYTFKEKLQFYDDVDKTLTHEELILWAKRIGSTTYQLPINVKKQVARIEKWKKIYKTSAAVITPKADYEK